MSLEVDNPFKGLNLPTPEDLSEYWEQYDMEIPAAIYAVNQQGNKFLVIEDFQSMFVLVSKIKPKTAGAKKREISVFMVNRDNCELSEDGTYYQCQQTMSEDGTMYCQQTIYIINSIDIGTQEKIKKVNESMWSNYMNIYINIDDDYNLNFDF